LSGRPGQPTPRNQANGERRWDNSFSTDSAIERQAGSRVSRSTVDRISVASAISPFAEQGHGKKGLHGVGRARRTQDPGGIVEVAAHERDQRRPDQAGLLAWPRRLHGFKNRRRMIGRSAEQGNKAEIRQGANVVGR
jgi:hypothetical protein